MLYRFVSCFLCITLVLGIEGCALINPHYTNTNQDGAPDLNIDVDQIPDAVPQKTFKQNVSSYNVRGRHYHVMRNARNYRERGLASWYGTRFYKGKTSSGERYNILAMTAAHKTLPIPSYVRVTHLKNGRHIIVKVNDRGPFKPGRVIDLSYVAAKKLGITKTGTAPVEVAIVEPGQISHRDPLPLNSYKKAKKSKKSHKKVHKILKAKHLTKKKHKLR